MTTYISSSPQGFSYRIVYWHTKQEFLSDTFYPTISLASKAARDRMFSSWFLGIFLLPEIFSFVWDYFPFVFLVFLLLLCFWGFIFCENFYFFSFRCVFLFVLLYFWFTKVFWLYFPKLIDRIIRKVYNWSIIITNIIFYFVATGIFGIFLLLFLDARNASVNTFIWFFVTWIIPIFLLGIYFLVYFLVKIYSWHFFLLFVEKNIDIYTWQKMLTKNLTFIVDKNNDI